MADALYIIALGSNRRHCLHGRPAGVLEAALAELDARFGLFDASPIIATPAMGPAGRDFANAVALVESALPPLAMLNAVKAMETRFGRRRGQRWGARVLDLDLIAWSGGTMASRRLTLPHAAAADRAFVLGPLASIAPRWRLKNGLTVRHLLARLGKARALG